MFLQSQQISDHKRQNKNMDLVKGAFWSNGDTFTHDIKTTKNHLSQKGRFVPATDQDLTALYTAHSS